MSRHTLSIAPGVILEHVGSDVVVMVPESTEVIKLSGNAAHTIRNIQAGDISVPPSETVSDLIERGIVVSEAGMSRRGLITAGALGAGAGIVMLSMPAAAAAGSGPELNGGNGVAGRTPVNGSYYVLLDAGVYYPFFEVSLEENDIELPGGADPTGLAVEGLGDVDFDVINAGTLFWGLDQESTQEAALTALGDPDPGAAESKDFDLTGTFEDAGDGEYLATFTWLGVVS